MPVITVHGPSGASVSYRLDRDEIVVGRSPDVDLYLRDPAVTRKHTVLRRTPSGWIAVDCDSRNGTKLNGMRIRGEVVLRSGDRIGIGRTVLTFEDETGMSVDDETADTEQIGGSSRGVVDGGEPVIVGRSAKISGLLAQIDKIARSPAPVLITGESGTGKELVARMIHHRSPRRSAPYVVVNCPALPGSLLEAELFGVEKGVATGVDPRRGRFEQAAGGTVLLDEIGDMEPAAQAKILRALQEGSIDRVGGSASIPVDVRVLAATNHDLQADIEAGSFRQDLYYRLKVFEIDVPPLRHRREDIPLLVEHFVELSRSRTLPFGPRSIALMRNYDFPGNVRELQHAVERALVLADGSSVRPEDLPAEFRTSSPAAGDDSDRLYDRIVTEGESFWEVVRVPYLRREIGRETVRSLIARGYAEADGSYKRMAHLFRIEDDHKKLLNFLRNHDLRPDP